MYNTIGLIMIGTLLGCCLMTILSIYMYKNSMIAEYCHNEDGVIWYLKEVGTSTINHNKVYFMVSTKHAGIRAVSQAELNNEFTLKKKFKKF